MLRGSEVRRQLQGAILDNLKETINPGETDGDGVSTEPTLPPPPTTKPSWWDNVVGDMQSRGYTPQQTTGIAIGSVVAFFVALCFICIIVGAMQWFFQGKTLDPAGGKNKDADLGGSGATSDEAAAAASTGVGASMTKSMAGPSSGNKEE